MRALAVAALVAAIAAPAGASGPIETTIRVCGRDGCGSVRGSPARFAAMLALERRRPTPPVARFYVLSLRTTGAPHAQRGYLVPSARTVRWFVPRPSAWIRLSRRDTALLVHAAKGRPHAAPAPLRVLVGGHRARDPRPYAHVYDRLPPVALPPQGRWLPLRLEWARSSPWRPEPQLLQALPRRRVLFRPGGWVRLPRSLAATIARDGHVQ